jgi:hypothetical protein
MNQIDRDRLIRDGILPVPSEEALENGEACAICWRPMECTGRPDACEECGGEGVLDEEGIEEAVGEHGQFGAGA